MPVVEKLLRIAENKDGDPLKNVIPDDYTFSTHVGDKDRGKIDF
jgi:hypothetical protein